MCCVVFVWCLYGVYVVSVWWCCAAAFGAYFGLSASWFLEKFRRGSTEVLMCSSVLRVMVTTVVGD